METHEYYSRPRNVKINRVTELGAWLKKQATQNAAPSLPERSSTHEDPSGTGSRRSDNEGDYAGEDRDTKETDVDFKDGVGSQGGSYLESEESGDDTDDSLMDKKTKVRERNKCEMDFCMTRTNTLCSPSTRDGGLTTETGRLANQLCPAKSSTTIEFAPRSR